MFTKKMSVFLPFLFLIVGCGLRENMAAPTQDTGAEPVTQILTGNIQYENPCVHENFPNGCLRLTTVESDETGNLKYINRPDRDNANDEFKLEEEADEGTVTFRLWYNANDSIVLSQNQTISMTVELDMTVITRILSVEPIEIEEPTIHVLRGLIQYENPCVRANFRNGCLRIWTAVGDQGGDIKYIDRVDHSPEAEFTLIDSPFGDSTTLFRIWDASLNSYVLSHNQVVAVTVELDTAGTTITKIHDVSLTGYLSGE